MHINLLNDSPCLDLIAHHHAFDRLWRAWRGAPPDPLPGAPRRVFPEGAPWRWEDDGGEAIPSQAAGALDERFRFTQRLFRRFDELKPCVHRPGQEARAVEGWEWSCVGIHQLWAGWTWAEGSIECDLRPALLDVVGDGFEEPSLERYDLLYPLARVEALAAELEGGRRRKGRGLRAAPWHGALVACATDHGFGPDQSAQLLSALIARGWARRRKRWVVVEWAGGRTRLRTTTFHHVARLILS